MGMGVSVVVAIVAPIVMYPFSRTVWSAIDLGMTPLTPSEEAGAIAALAAEGKEWTAGQQSGKRSR